MAGRAKGCARLAMASFTASDLVEVRRFPEQQRLAPSHRSMGVSLSVSVSFCVSDLIEVPRFRAKREKLRTV